MKKVFIWILAFAITLIAVISQRLTSPFYPKAYKIQIGDDTYNVKLERSHAGPRDCVIEIAIDDKDVSGFIYFKKFGTKDEYSKVRLTQYRNEICGILPHLPPLHQLQYYVELTKDNKNFYLAKDKPVVIRFNNDIPLFLTVPNALLLFLAIFFSTISGLYVIYRKNTYRKYVNWAFFSLILGGVVFGLLIQKYAFNVFWTGIPFTYDLANNQVLFAFVFLLWAYLANRKKENKVSVLVASVATLAIFSVSISF